MSRAGEDDRVSSPVLVSPRVRSDSPFSCRISSLRNSSILEPFGHFQTRKSRSVEFLKSEESSECVATPFFPKMTVVMEVQDKLNIHFLC